MSQCIHLRSALARIVALGVVGGSVWGAGVVVAEPALADAGRAFELVSPAEKGGQSVFYAPGSARVGITRASVDGDAAVYTSWGNFADAEGGLPLSYRARRTPSGWANEAVSPGPHSPDPDAAIHTYQAVWEEAARDLSTGYAQTEDSLDAADVNNTFDIYETGPHGMTDLVSRGNGGERLAATDSVNFTSGYGTISPDGRHVIFSTDAHLVPQDASRTDGRDLYERFNGKTVLVNLKDDGTGPLNNCGSRLSAETNRHSISDEGSRIIFETPSKTGADDCALPTEIYMRVGGARTIHISASQRDPVDSTRYDKLFRGASADGNTIYFTSTEKLTDTATAGGFYRYTVSTGRLEQLLSGPTSLIRVIKISADGRRVYFESQQSWTDGGVRGRSNLYYLDDDGVTFIVTDRVGSGFNIGGSFEPGREANVTPNGDYLVFVSKARMTDFDNAGRREVYLYDAVRSELRCVSCDPAGQRLPGSRPVSDAAIKHELVITDDNTPAITPDGRTVVFDTADQLVAGDTNGRRDIYEYRDGRLSLVTTGRATSDATLVGVAGNGRDIFFTTATSLVAADVDGGNIDLYDARVGGGFPEEAVAPRQPCLGDSCQGGGALRPDFGAPGTEWFVGEGQIDEPEVVLPPDKALSVRRLTRAEKKRFARTGRMRLTLRTAGGGTVRVRGTSRIGRRNRVVIRMRKTVKTRDRATTHAVVRLNSTGRRALKKRGRLRLRLIVRLSGLSQQRVLSLTLTRNRT